MASVETHEATSCSYSSVTHSSMPCYTGQDSTANAQQESHTASEHDDALSFNQASDALQHLHCWCYPVSGTLLVTIAHQQQHH